MARKSRDFLEKLKKKHGVNEIWSWSRYHNYKIDEYSYYLKYIKHEKETETNIYTVSGGFIHDCIEKFYNKEIAYENMLPLYEDKLFEMNLSELKYNRSDEEANKRIAVKYEDNIRLFFKNHIPITDNMITEQYVTIKVGKYLFQGYIDAVTKDKDGTYTIIDWKSSTIYTGKKVLSEAGQLLLYAESLMQLGVPIEKIKIGWNFLKYCTVVQTTTTKDKATKLHKTREKNCLRTEMVKGVEGNIRKWLAKQGYDELEIEDFVATAIENNSFDKLPNEVKNKFEIKDCFVTIPLTLEIVNELKEDIIETLDEINYLKEKYDETGDDTLFWTSKIDKSNSFYFANLCGYSVKVHRPYKEYLEEIGFFNKVKPSTNKKSDEDLKEFDNWLDSL